MNEHRPNPLPAAVAWLVLGFGVLFACLLAFGHLAGEIGEQEAYALDSLANPLLHGLASSSLDTAMGAITDMGAAPVIPVLLVVALAALVVIRRRREALLLVVAIAGSTVLNLLLKVAVHRPRPPLAWARALPDYSFPSGHTQNAVVFYLALALVVWVVAGRRAGIVAVAVAVVLAVAVGASRIYLGAHYLTDVVAGALAGVAWLLVVGAAFEAGPMLREWRGAG